MNLLLDLPQYFEELEKLTHQRLKEWILSVIEMCNPEKILLIDGSEEQRTELLREAVATGEIVPLDNQKWSGCYYHRSATNDVARSEHLTYICTLKKEDAGPTNNWMPPDEAYKTAAKIFDQSMVGRTLYIIPFSMGPIGSSFSKICVQLTDSIYVVLNMLIMTRVSKQILEILGTNGQFTKGLHSKADLDEKKRLILHFPQDNTIWSVGSGYGGNALLGKKCLALRIASYLGRYEGWLAEHMLIVGIQDPSGEITYIAGAFPSACGKTNLAMLMPPKRYAERGYKVWTVGEDIAWLRIGPDGRLWAVNPEAGYFGVIPGTNSKTNPNAMKTIKGNTIFTNVVLTKTGDIWWEGADGEPPVEGTAWDGRSWVPGTRDENGNLVKGAHPNSRFTVPATQNPVLSPEWENPQGVPISAIIFGARRSTVAPLVYESFNWQHGVYIGATMASERTAAQYGKVGEVRRDPMAMLPFCGYNMADYFAHWLAIGKKLAHPPKIFHVNWFRVNEHGNFIWPGFGENIRVIEWILRRCQGLKEAVKTPIGFIPAVSNLDLAGLQLTEEQLKQLFLINPDEWDEELKGQYQFLNLFGSRMPKELLEEHAQLKARFLAQ